MATSKIIVLGDVNGQLPQVFKKLTLQHTKNNLTFAIIAGNLFGENDDVVDELLADKIKIPLPTYFTIGTKPLPTKIIEILQTNEDICENLYYLGKCSTTKTLDGLRIVALGGLPDPAQPAGRSQDKYTPFHTIADAKSLYGAHSADILITAAWPALIRNGSNMSIPENVTPPLGFEHISDLCLTLKPRYHFSATPDLSFEREPFLQRASLDYPDSKPVTRFLSLAPLGNSQKFKALYAFNLTTKVDESAVPPPLTTVAPFALVSKRRREALEPEPYSRYGGGDHGGRDYRGGKKRRYEQRPPPDPKACFFCLSREESEDHLVVAIGEVSYVTIAKGPLFTVDSFKESGYEVPAHALIICQPHCPTIAEIPTQDNTDKHKVYEEMCRFKGALQKMVGEISNNKLGAVTYEISLRRGMHNQWQFLPMPVEKIAHAEIAFKAQSLLMEYFPFQDRDPGVAENEGDFFRVWTWCPPTEDAPEGTTKCMVMPIDDTIRFDLQFGRRALAQLFEIEKRTVWRDCPQTKEEEVKYQRALFAAFKPYDFTE